MNKTCLGMIAICCLLWIGAAQAAEPVSGQTVYPEAALEKYWQCKERTDLEGIKQILWKHQNVDHVDASIYGLPPNDFDDHSLLTVDERLWYRKVREDEKNPLPTEGPIQYPHFMREAIDRLYIVNGNRPDCAQFLEGQGITVAEANKLLQSGWSGDKDLTSGDSNARGEIHVAIDHASPNRILVSTCPASAAETSNPTWHTTDYGATWTKTVNGNNSGSTWECDPFGYYQRSTGNVYQAKIGCNTGSCGSTYTMMRKSTDNGGTWSDCGRPDTATNSDREQYAIDNTPTSSCYGKIYVTWHNGNAEQVAVSGDSCATWTKTALTAASQAITPDVGIGADGHVYVVWGNFGTSQFMVAGSSNCGSTWNAPSNTAIKAYNGAWSNNVPAQCVRGIATEPLVDVDRCPWSAYYKRVYVVMADYEASGTDLGCSPTYNNTHNYELWLSYSDDSGATWHKPSNGATGADNITSFEGATVDDFFPWLRVDEADGAVYVAWTRSRLAPASLTDRQITATWAMRSLDGGKTWSTPYQVSSVENSERTSGSDTFERGDYQAMDVVQGVLYPVWIDRRSPTAGSQTAEHPITRKVCTEPAHVSERAPTFTAPPTTATTGASKVINISWTLPDIFWGDGGENAAARKFQLWVDGALYQDNISASTTSTTYAASDCSTAHTFVIRAINSCSVSKDYAPASATATGCCANDPSSVDVTPNGPLTLCQGTGQLLSTTLTGGTGPFIYQWTKDGGVIPGATSPTYLANDTGAHAYNCMVYGSGCSQPSADSVSTVITWQSSPTFAGVASVTNPHNSTCTLALGWSAATSACPGPFTYSVYRSTTSPFTPGAGNRIASGVTGTSYNDAVGISTGTTYYYIVHAVDGSNGAEDANTVTLSGAPSGPITTTNWTDTFEGALSGGGFDLAGWTHNAITGTTNWAWSTAQKHDGTHSWFASDIATASDMVLVSPSFGVGAGPNTTLSFWHTFAFEGTVSTCYDAGTLEYSADGTSWSVVPAADFTAGAYTGTANASYSNPIGGSPAWCAGTVGALTQVTVNLGGDATLVGKTIQLRWHEGNDSSTAATGWYVDTVAVSNAQAAGSCTTGSGCTAPGAPTLTNATGTCNGVNLAWSPGTGTTSSYNVYRSTTPGGPYTLLGSPPTTTATTYTDTTAVAGTTYYYVVRGACDAGGTSESGNSNELSAARLVSPTPTITGASTNTCPATSVPLTTESGQSNYQWYVGGSPIGGATSNTYTATASGTYTVSYTNSFGCSGVSVGKTVTIVTCAPNIVYQSHGTITQVTGNGDAYYERGEKWSVSVTLTNTGNLQASNVTATFGGNGITVCAPTASFGAIAPGGTGTATFQFVISPTFTPCGGAINFNITGKTSTELTPAGADENGVFNIQVGHSTVGSPTQLVIQPSVYDTYVNQFSATTNYGTATTMLTNVRSSREEDVLVQFDLSGIPANSTITSATLELYNTVAPASAYAVNVHRNTATWTETAVNWNTKPAYDATYIAQITPTTAVGWKIWTVTSAVQAWYTGTYTNYGFTVRPNATSGSTTVLYTFASRENATTANRPILRVSYTPATTWDCSYTGAGTCCNAPTAPTNNTATDLDLCAATGVQITWAQDVPDWADGGSGTRTYDVLRNGSAIASGLAYGTTSYTDTTGASGTSYTYAVRYNNGCGSSVTTTGASASDNAPVCTALDQCHNVGTCDPGTGICSNPVKTDGTACTDDGNVCTQDYCAAGACTHPAGNAGTLCRASAGVCDLPEYCTGTSTTCPADGFASSATPCTGASQGGLCDDDAADHCSGTANTCVDVYTTSATVCRASAGQCDVAETCTGTSGACPADGFASSATPCTGTSQSGLCDNDAADHCSGTANTCVDVYKTSATVCRASAGQCDVAETCTGTSGACPADGFASSATPCTGASQGGLCDNDAADHCSGAANTCVDVYKTSATVCRASAGQCDVAETCTGTSGACPADGFASSATPCTGTSQSGLCDNDAADHCSGTANTCVDVYKPSATVCRASAGQCDVAETCTGTSGACPVDAKSTTVCRPAAGDCDVAESCDGVNNDCPVDAFKPSTVECRGAAGVCDVAEFCTGSDAACPADAKSTAVCRPAAGDCDVAESCDGVNNDCPADAYKPSTVECRGAAGVCDIAEFCTGTGAACPADAKSTAVCRPATGDCDVAESCDGVNNDCPADAFKPSTVECRSAAGVCDVAEFCTGSSAACPADAKSTAVCRPAAGDCDVAESCDGVNNDCPADAFKPSTVECRGAAGVCDVAEFCTGSSASCPADAKSTAVCRPATGDCDVAESCDGVNNDCPADVFKPSTVECRGAAGVCDIAEFCTGSGAACPADAKSTATCRPAAGDCDVAESCDGVSNDCPADAFQPTSVQCRAAAGACDIAEFCTGSSAACPADAKSTAICRPAANDCDVAESCDGINNDCPADAFKPSTVECRGAAGVCDVAEFCTGSSAGCPADAKSTAICRPAAGDCDVAETCDGVTNDCPADAFKPSTVECRGAAGVCDVAEFCTGSSASCPADAKSTAVCRPAAGDCDVAESCDGVNNDCPADAFKPSTVECRGAAGVCDVAEFCTGSSASCPADAKSTAVCRPAAGVCDLAESCDGVNNDCPADAFQPVSVQCRAAAGACDIAEFCTGSSAACPADAKSTAICRPAAGDCDVAESCDGINNDCPADAVQPVSVQCRAAAGACDIAEFCTGSSAACPADAKSTAICRPAAGDCDVAESCDGINNDCPANAYKPSTVECRGAAGVCDVAEFCTGSDAACPADAKSTAVCRPAAGDCDVAESCDGVTNDCPADAYKPSTVECRAAAGVCDVAEFCTGTSAACPADAKSTAVCRPVAGICDVAENCNGVSNDCPADAFQPSSVQCRAAAGMCDVAEFCTGANAACPADVIQPDGTACDDGNPYTTNDHCLAGACAGQPVEAAPGDTPSGGQGWSGTGVTTWPPLPGVTGYRLYRGGPADLPYLLDANADSCLRYQGPSTSANTPEVPAPGTFFWYLVTALNGTLEGPAGAATSGPRVVNSTGACP